MNNYGIFFTLGSKVIRLPVNPEELPDALQGANETYNILGIGEVTALRTPLQRTIEIQGLFPAKVDSYVVTPNKFMKPEEYIKFFRDAMYNKNKLIYTPVRYMEDGSPFASDDIGFTCTVDSFEVREAGGETGDFYYTLSIKEYRDYTPQRVKVVPGMVKTTVTVNTQTNSSVSSSAVTTSKTRAVDQGIIVVGSQVKVNGPVSDTYEEEETTGKQNPDHAGTTAVVARLQQGKSKPYLLKDMQGQILGWSNKQSLFMMSTLA